MESFRGNVSLIYGLWNIVYFVFCAKPFGNFIKFGKFIFGFWNKFLMFLFEQNMFVSSVICLLTEANLRHKNDKKQRTQKLNLGELHT